MQKASGPNVADWQYLGVYKFTRWLKWNYERGEIFSSNREDTFAYVSFSSKDYHVTRHDEPGIARAPRTATVATSSRSWRYKRGSI